MVNSAMTPWVARVTKSAMIKSVLNILQTNRDKKWGRYKGRRDHAARGLMKKMPLKMVTT